MSPFEALYGRKCITPLNWSETRDCRIVCPKFPQVVEEEVRMICYRLRATQSMHNSYYDQKHREFNFEPGKYAYLGVRPLHKLQRFHIKGKLSPRFIGPFQVLARKGKVACQLESPEDLTQVYDVFHIFTTQKVPGTTNKADKVQGSDTKLKSHTY